MKAQIRNRCSDYNGYRAARVKSLFNAESGCDFSRDFDIDIDDGEWSIGVVVGPSGSGKTSLGRSLGGLWSPPWPSDQPIIEAIAPESEFNDVTGALSAVGLGDVPAWLRPYDVLSNGEKFRADMARLVCDRPEGSGGAGCVVVDEFTSVVDRQIARMGSLAFGKAWRRGPGRVVLLTPHYDVVEWLEPDWVLDTATGRYAGRGLWRRPRFDLEIRQANWSYWPLFEPHHYLKLPKMVAATCYVGSVDGELVAHVAVSTRPGMREGRACRLVVMPEWQGAGVGTRFLNEVCRMWLNGENRFSKSMQMLFHTSHPGLCAAIRRMPEWRQVSCSLFGGNKAKSKASVIRSGGFSAGYGGHVRAAQGFRYYGRPGGAV